MSGPIDFALLATSKIHKLWNQALPGRFFFKSKYAIYIYTLLVYLSVCLFVSNKRQNG